MKHAKDILWLILVGPFAAAGCLALFVTGCASRPEKKCVGDTCYIRASAEQVNRRCTKGKQTWDDGSAYDANSSKTARCCIVFRKQLWGGMHKRFAMWITEGEESCIPHEECHKTLYVADGYKFVPERHKMCHDFGLGRPKGMPK